MLEDHFRTLFNDFTVKKEAMYDVIRHRDGLALKSAQEIYEKAEVDLLLFLEDNAEEILKRLEKKS